MRPDQQPVNVAEVLLYCVPCFGAPISHDDIETLKGAVAEYIAANDEYDAAYLAYEGRSDEWDSETWNSVMQRYAKAKTARALAHARMKGETK